MRTVANTKIDFVESEEKWREKRNEHRNFDRTLLANLISFFV